MDQFMLNHSNRSCLRPAYMTPALANTKQHMCAPTSAPPGAPPRPARARAAPRSSPLFAPRPLGTWASRQTGREAVKSNGRRAVTPASCRGEACLMERLSFWERGFPVGGPCFQSFSNSGTKGPLTGNPRHEHPPLPPQICLGYVLNLNTG